MSLSEPQLTTKITTYAPSFDKIISVALYKNPPSIETETVTKTILNSSVTFTKPKYTYETKPDFVISCPATGRKPNISLTWKEVEGTVGYDITITIKNAFLNAVDIQSYSRMLIEAGYPNEKIYLDSPIMYAYTDSPPPNNSVVFGGLAVGSINQIFSTIKNISVIQHRDSNASIGTLVTSVCNLCGFIIDTPCGVVSETGQVSSGINSQFKDFWESQWYSDSVDYELKASSVMEMMNKLADQVISMGKNSGLHAFVVLTMGKFCIGLVEENRIINSSLKNEIIYLNNVVSASFSGPVLTATAPWVPNLRPFSLFCMPPQFYTTKNTLTQMTKERLHLGEWDVYRTFQISVEFDTCSNKNQMTVVAIPVISETGEASSSSLVSKALSLISGSSSSSSSTTSVENAEYKAEIGDTWTFNEWVLDNPEFPYQTSGLGKSTFSGYTIEYNTNGNNYTDLCYKHYDKQKWKVQVGKKQYTFDASILWPLVVQLTYDLHNQMKQGLGLSAIHDPKNPLNSYQKGDTLAFPIISSLPDGLVSLDTGAKIQQIYFDWITVMYNWDRATNSLDYQSEVRSFIGLYTYLSIQQGSYLTLQVTNTGVESVGLLGE